MEASSHGLAQFRFEIAIITGRFHQFIARPFGLSCDRYAAAKQRLFTDILAADGTAVITMTHEAGSAMAAACADAGRKVLEVGRVGDAVHMAITARRATGLDVAIEIDGARHDVALPLIGDFQIENLTLALGMAQAAGMDSAIMLEACRDLQRRAGASGWPHLKAQRFCRLCAYA